MSDVQRMRSRIIVGATALCMLLVVSVFMFPVIAQDRGSETSLTLSRLKRQAFSIAMYCTDFDDRLPPAVSWMDAVLPYAKDTGLFDDPTIRERKKGEYGFAFFRPLSGLATSKIIDTDKMPLTLQSKDLSRNANGLLDLLPYRLGEHRGNYVSFVDCHAKFMPESWRFETIVIDLSQPEALKDE